MKNDNQFNIVYKHYIPDKWIEEFEDKIKTEKLSIRSIKDNDEFDNFSGPELSDIIVFIKDYNLDSIFLAPAYYEIVKYGIISLWKKLRKLDVKIVKASSIEPKQKKISIRYEDVQGRKLNINLEADISEDLIEDVVEESLDLIKTEKKESIYAQEDFIASSKDKITIEFQYNKEYKKWEPVNFGDMRRYWDKLIDDIDKKY